VRLRAALAVVPLLLLPVACGKDVAKQPTGTLPGVTISGEFGKLPEIKAKDLKAPAKPTSVTVSKGDGPKVTTGHDSLLHLTLFSGVDGKKLISTLDSNRPVLTSQVSIQGLADALKGASRGSRVALESTADKTVGAQGATQLGIKAGDAVVLVADVVSVAKENALAAPKGSAQTPPEGTPKVVATGDKVTGFDWAGVGAKPSAVKVITLVQGDGPAIQKGRLVTFNYFGELFKGKKPFDESFSKSPATFAVGVGGLIPAWDEGLVGIKEGSRVLILTPPDKAYGAQGSGAAIPPNSTLAFVIDVLGVDG
jgi:peptidylprolyl isomerase